LKAFLGWVAESVSVVSWPACVCDVVWQAKQSANTAVNAEVMNFIEYTELFME
jgi:hypothetical protein